MFALKRNFPDYYRYQGRKISKKISQQSIDLLNKYYYEYTIDHNLLQYYESPNNKKLSFKEEKYTKINLEIGFGDGEYLIKSAFSNPKELFIGSEVYINGIAKVLKQILSKKISNIKLCGINSLYLLKALQHESVNKIFIINPDPWPKKRHCKRRIITFENLCLLSKIVTNKDSILITTDSESYLDYIHEIYKDNKKVLGNINLDILAKGHHLYGVSKYQRKAIKNQEKIFLITI